MSFTIHPNGYWESADCSGHFTDMYLLYGMIRQLKRDNVSSILDLGCGTGYYVSGFREEGFACDGYDGNPNTPEITGNLCKVADLSQPVSLGMYDCVLSLEVGEHIPEIYEQTFITNVCAHSSKYVIISWAVPNQPGIGHINCQLNEYIIRRFKEHSFEFVQEDTDFLRGMSDLYWFKSTLMVFKKS